MYCGPLKRSPNPKPSGSRVTQLQLSAYRALPRLEKDMQDTTAPARAGLVSGWASSLRLEARGYKVCGLGLAT